MYETHYRTHTCGELRLEDRGKTVCLAGWIHRCRDQGGLVFFDLRDRYGLTQVSVSKEEYPEAHAVAAGLKSEYTVQIEGSVLERPESARNAKLATGAIEIAAHRIAVLSLSPTPPIDVAGKEEISEEVRLKHRPLDLRRAENQARLMMRHKMNRTIRAFLEERDFVEIETPILAKATPEGARDYIVPSRIHPGKFYALPQAPQMYKQILMCAGYDRYYQIARCFRDEDLRADRQPEFTQLDMEMSFVGQDDILGPIEELLSRCVKDVAFCGCELPRPWPRISYDDALKQYGSDKPDLRFALEIVDLTDIARDCSFKVFRGAVDGGGAVRGIRVPGGAAFSRREIEAFQPVAAVHGAKGLAWMKLGPDGASGPVAKFFSGDELPRAMQAEVGDALLFVADASTEVVALSLGAVRLAVAKTCGLIDENAFAACFVVDFPMFLPDGDGGWTPAHHAFTMPVKEDLAHLESDPGRVRAQAYDPVLNGVELGSGSIRIHRPEVQQAVFRAMGLSEEIAQDRFGFFLELLQYGAPPHGGIALGLDRLAMLLCGAQNIRDVIAFPKTASAVDLMADSPSAVNQEQLDELRISVDLPEASPGAGRVI